MIADAIDAAQATVWVQAYWLTSASILRGLAGAKGRRMTTEVTCSA